MPPPLIDVDARAPTWTADVVTARRVAWRLGLMDLDGYLVAREPGGDGVTFTPGPDGSRPAHLALQDLGGVGLDTDGADLPDMVGFGLVLAILRHRPDAAAIAVGSPHTAMALGSVHREILPLTHTGAAVALQGAAWIDAEAYLSAPIDADALARTIGDAGFVQIPGVALVALGSEPLDALRRLHVLEDLARMTLVATALNPDPGTVTQEQSAAIPRQRPVEPRPSRDYRRYYRSLERPSRSPASRATHGSDSNAIERVKGDVALACRILAAQGDLVAFFEHVSHRIGGFDDRFAMSPAKAFADMQPHDIGIIATAGDCELLEGDIPAAPFRWYHRDLLMARPDVNAVVHTHELLGRAYVMAAAASPPVHRFAVHGMRGQMPPVFPEPSLLFELADRAAMLKLLGDGPWVHSQAHGTDFCAADIATATIAAIHRERHLRFHILASRLGEPVQLSDAVLDALADRSATAPQWWDGYADELVI